MHSQVDVGFDPALFPRSRPVDIERNAIDPCIAPRVKEQAPRVGVVVFPSTPNDIVLSVDN